MPFGFKLAPGAASKASLADKLRVLGSALADDDSGAAAMAELQGKLERERLASEVADRLERANLNGGRELQEQQRPQAETQAPPPVADPTDATAASMASRLQDQSLGDLPMRQAASRISAPEPSADLPMRSDAAAPAQGGQSSLYAELLPRLLRAAGKGVDPSGISTILQREDYARGLPMKDQAKGRVDPKQVMEWEHDDALPMINETSPGATTQVRDRRDGRLITSDTAPDRAQPVTTERVIGVVLDKAMRGDTLTPHEQKIYDRWEKGSDGFYGERAPERTTASGILGDVLDKVRRGGVEGLSPGETAIWERYNRKSDPFGGLMEALGGDDEGDEEAPTPVAAPRGGRGGGGGGRTVPAPLPRKGQAAGGAPPPAALSQLREGQQTTFGNGQVWTLAGGQPKRLR